MRNHLKPLSILCVHQGNELYGSDTVFIQTVKAFRHFFPKARIDIILPGQGPIESKISRYADSVFYDPILVLRKSHIKTVVGLIGLMRLPYLTLKALKAMKQYELIYINTIVIANFLLAAIFKKKIRFIHIHEIIPGIAGRLAGWFARKAASAVICNSYATANSFGIARHSNVFVIWNGVRCPDKYTPPETDARHSLKILMPGRINSWKGQDLLIKAIGRLGLKIQSHLEVRIAGDVYHTQHFYRENLIHLIQQYNLKESVHLVGFCHDMKEMYEWADVVIVPSLKPEPFGLVAIEAMSHGRPVIGSAHGGLKEIIIHNTTGWLIPPGNPDILANLLTQLVMNRLDLKEKGRQARKRAESVFSESGYQKNIGMLASSFLNKS